MSSIVRSSLRHSSRAAQQMQLGGSSSSAFRARRSYSDKPTSRQGGNTGSIIIAVVGISVPLLYLWQSQNTSAQKHSLPDNYTAPAAPSTDPAASVRATKDEAKARDGKAKYEHPEDREPEKFKPAFGRVHERKRVDGAPHGRNHQELMDRQRQE